jgi:hypothetical protein
MELTQVEESLYFILLKTGIKDCSDPSAITVDQCKEAVNGHVKALLGMGSNEELKLEGMLDPALIMVKPGSPSADFLLAWKAVDWEKVINKLKG